MFNIELLIKNHFIRFIFFGGLNTLFAYLLLAVCLYLEFHYAVATLIAAFFSILSGYFLNLYLVFKANSPKNLYIYYLFWFCMYLLSVFIQYLLGIYFSGNLYLNSFIATAVCVVISFFMNKYYLFR